MRYDFRIGEKEYSVEIVEIRGKTAHVVVDGHTYEIQMEGLQDYQGQPPSPTMTVKTGLSSPHPPPSTQRSKPLIHSEDSGGAVIKAPIPGLILEVKVNVGDLVTAGQVVAIMEAMKMENALTSSATGKVKEIRVQKGSEVSTDDVIMLIQ
jgi:biotin carboxyl carrier protein